MQPSICLALDFEPEMNSMLAKKFQNLAGFVKLGPQNIFESGPDIINKYFDMGFKVFLDCKFHDIPQTIARVAKVLKNVDIITLHMSAGKSAFQLTQDSNPKIKIAGVARLTSLSETDWTSELGFPLAWPEKIRNKAIADGWPVNYFVLSGAEFKIEKPILPCIIPGIKLDDETKSVDQKNVTLLETLQSIGKEHILVLGRCLLQPKTFEVLQSWQ